MRNNSSANTSLYIFGEAAAIPCLGRKGRLITLGLATQPSNAQTGVESAINFVKRNGQWIADQLSSGPNPYRYPPPYIDWEGHVRLNQQTGEVMTKDADVDIILHLPPHVNASYTAPSMVVAIICMLWRLPCHKIKTWSLMGTFDLDGRLYGCSKVNKGYVELAEEEKIEVLLTVPSN